MNSPAARSSFHEDVDDLNLARSEWLSKVLKKHPDILGLRERVRGITGDSSYGRNHKSSAKTEVPEVLSDENITGLIMQFMSEEGLDSALKALEKETNCKYLPYEYESNGLATLLRIGAKSLASVFDPTVASQAIDADPDIDGEVEAHLAYIDEEDEDGDAKDVNIWMEPPDSADNIAVVDGLIKAGSLNKLVIWLTSPQTDFDYRKTFFLTHHSFTTSERLLKKLIQRYENPEEGGHRDHDHASVIAVIKFWLDKHPTDFKDKILTILNQFIDNTLVKDGHTSWAKQLRGIIAKIESAQSTSGSSGTASQSGLDLDASRVFQNKAPAAEPMEPKVPKNIFSPTLTLDDIDEEEIARQLCILDFQIYESILPSELLSKSWTRPQTRGKSPNVIRMIARFNEVAVWVASSLLAERKSRSQKARMLARFLKICDHLKNLNNFQSLAAIYSSISSVNVSRAIVSFSKEVHNNQMKTLADLDRLFSCEGGYSEYRAAYNSAMMPCIPYLGIHLRDLVFVEEGMPEKLRHGKMINFYKREVIATLIQATLRNQHVRYHMYRVHQIQVFLDNFKLFKLQETEQ